MFTTKLFIRSALEVYWTNTDATVHFNSFLYTTEPWRPYAFCNPNGAYGWQIAELSSIEPPYSAGMWHNLKTTYQHGWTIVSFETIINLWFWTKCPVTMWSGIGFRFVYLRSQFHHFGIKFSLRQRQATQEFIEIKLQHSTWENLWEVLLFSSLVSCLIRTFMICTHHNVQVIYN